MSRGEGDIKDRAITAFIKLVAANNQSLGKRLSDNRESIYWTVLGNIQRIGVHAYAERILKRSSFSRDELERALDRKEA